MKKQFKLLCGVAALMVAGSAGALTTLTLGGTSATATMTGWVNNSTGKLVEQQLTPYGNSYGFVNTGISDEAINQSEPEHAVDNMDRYEMVAINFAANKVKLSDIGFGWVGSSHNYDSQYTILAYTGTTDLTKKATDFISNSNTGWGALAATGSGWTLIGNFKSVTDNAIVSTGASVYSSFWLVGAFNNIAAGTSALSNVTNPSNGDIGDDAIKLKSIAGSVCSGQSCSSTTSIPEPGSIALFGLGILGLVGVRRNRKH